MSVGVAHGNTVTNNLPFLRRHYPKQSFTMVADTPENLRLKQQSELQSQVSVQVSPRPGLPYFAPSPYVLPCSGAFLHPHAEEGEAGLGCGSLLSDLAHLGCVYCSLHLWLLGSPRGGKGPAGSPPLPVCALHQFTFSQLTSSHSGFSWTDVDSLGKYFR